MKRTAVMLITLIFLLCGCDGLWLKSGFRSVITENSWTYFDYEVRKNEKIICGKNGEFNYCYEDGEPITDFYVYKTYSFDSRRNMLILENEEMGNKEIPVIACNDHHMLLNIDGKIKDFKNSNQEYIFYELNSKYVPEVEGYAGCFSIFDINRQEKTVLLNSPHYDGDEKKDFEDFFEEYKISDEIKISSLSVIVDESGDKPVFIEEREVMDIDETKAILEDSLSIGFVWLNKDLAVEKILFYGETIFH